jgi:CheY-like chemotaxis protein
MPDVYLGFVRHLHELLDYYLAQIVRRVSVVYEINGRLGRALVVGVTIFSHRCKGYRTHRFPLPFRLGQRTVNRVLSVRPHSIAVIKFPVIKRKGSAMSFVKGRILYTEDDLDCRNMVVFTLEQSGYEVICVDSGEKALSLAQREHFDLFLVDNWMPGLTGPELTRHIREFNQTTPILFYSGAAYEDDKQAALDAGAQGYLVKPIGIDSLIGEVDRLIRSV